ncbi:DMT family transporter [Arcobacter sp. YIC-80]|uniref:DMT family transporter n=1 Tax=Arcobacter sp. YIC-80 TaxID=3376683 RepID=UPI00384C997A
MNTLHLKAHIFVMIATILVAGSFIVTQKLAGLISPFSLILLRFFASAIILAPLIFIKKRYRDKILSTMPRAMVISFFYAGYFVLMFVALETTTALNTGALYTLVPLVTAIFCIFIFKDKITLFQWIVYLIGIVGTLGVVFKADLSLFLSLSLNNGDLIYLVGILFMTFYSITMKTLYKQDDPILLVFCTLLGGALWMAIILAFINEPLNWGLVKDEMIFYMAYLVIATTIITLYLYQKATIILGPKSVMSYIYLTPAIIAVFVYFVDEVTLSFPVIIAITISLIATLILQFKIKN